MNQGIRVREIPEARPKTGSMANSDCITPQNTYELRFLPFGRELSVRYLGFRPDCEGVRHPLRFRTGQVFPRQQSWIELTDALEGTEAFADSGS